MYLIIKTIILCILSSVTSQKIEYPTASSEGIIIGPETPIFYTSYPRRDYVKVKREENVFSPSPAYNYYLDPSNRDGVLFVDILIVIDYWLYENRNHDDDIKEIVLKGWLKVNEYFEQINSPRIKFEVAGISVSQVPDVWNIQERTISKHVNSSTNKDHNFYLIPSTLDNMQNWFTNNKDGFEGLSYDLFIYMSSCSFTNDTRDDNEVLSFAYYDDICPKNDTHEFVANGGLVFVNDFFSYNAAEIIAVVLGVPLDDSSKCGSGYIMDPKLRDHVHETWSECSKEAFKKMNNNPKSDCLKHTTYKEVEMIDDY